MKSLYLRIWLTVVAALALFALAAGWLVQHHLAQERAQADALLAERLAGWSLMIEDSLPQAGAPAEDQAARIEAWSDRLKLPMALDDAQGRRIGTSEVFAHMERDGVMRQRRPVALRLSDGRTLWVFRPGWRRLPPDLDRLPLPGRAASGPQGSREALQPADSVPDARQVPPAARFPRGPGPQAPEAGMPWTQAPGRLDGPQGPPPDLRGPGGLDGPEGLNLPGLTGPWSAQIGLLALGGLLFLAVAVGAYPVVRRLTRRLESLQQGVEAFGAGDLGHRVPVEGRDEVSTLARSFNQAAERIEALVRSNQRLLANASHELRSPLARLKMAAAMLGGASAAQLPRLQQEVDTNIRELDALVDEVLLSSRLEAGAAMPAEDVVDLLGLAVEECARVGAELEGPELQLRASDRLLRRAVRNLLENARRYGGDEVLLRLAEGPGAEVLVEVCDRGPGVPEAERERIFEPFYRLPGHAERDGGVGLGLALVRQIARHHGGEVRCLARDGGGSCFQIRLPASRRLA
ncbi:sensor histidine kinase [Ideonella livida]|uniref:histidine kinase n=1 Tax=Ideonella livida TaxID=2707176 RepID=A0A7C9TK89_9BURK|nr:ATP-binding protein [Ideonella livida]NDY90186.1 HAMP domain-containing protein [Ideonella livida]